MKRILALLLCFALCLSLLPASFAEDIEIVDSEEMEETLPEEEIAVAEPAAEPEQTYPTQDAETDGEIVASGECGDNLTWTLDDEGTLTISGEGNMTDYSHTSTLVRHAPWYDSRSLITAIVINEGVTNIGDFAFYYCSSAISATISESVTDIGTAAFSDCSKLSGVVISSNIANIGAYAFRYCNSFRSVRFSGSAPSIGSDCFLGDNIYAYYPMGDSTWGSGVMKQYGGTITWVPYGSVSGNCGAEGDNLTWTYNDHKILTISGTGEMRDFNEGGAPWEKYKSNIETVVINDGATSIGNNAFNGYNNLTSVSIPSSVTRVGANALNCSYIFSAGPIGGNYNIMFGWTESIPGTAFKSCSNLKSITFPDTIKTVGESLLHSNRNLQSIYISDLAAWCEIDFGDNWWPVSKHDIYLHNELITELIIPDGITIIANGLFYGCNNITSVTLPDSVNSIGDHAFEGCSSLAELKLPNSLTILGSYAFGACTLLSSLSIPNEVTSIGDYAFSACSGLTSVTIPNSVTSIGEFAFRNCKSLKSIIIPSSVISMGRGCFNNCLSMTNVEIEDGLAKIEDSVFSGCSSLTSVTIPNSVTRIGRDSFRRCSSLLSVSFSGSVSIISRGAFYQCDSLKEVFFDGYEALAKRYKDQLQSWDKEENDPLFNADWYYLKSLEEGWNLCGDNLFWQYDGNNRTLSFKGDGAMWDFISIDYPWREYSNKIVYVFLRKVQQT